MDWGDTADQASFRERVRQFIEERLPERYQQQARDAHHYERPWEFDRASDRPEAREAATAWSDALAEQRWSAPHWPAEYGGGGLTPMEQFILKQELGRASAPSVGGSGIAMLGPTLILNGSEEQRREHLPPILAGTANWAQGFSEPGAGSDLASLATSARRDGDEYVINGQKIWTSAAHTADWFFLLTRTDPDAPKHRGISFLLLDARTPGISVQPLVDMSWVHYFNETFFEDVRVPVSNLVGEENRGWYVAMNLLDFERSNVEGAMEAQHTVRLLVEYASTPEGREQSRLTSSTTLRTEVAERYVESHVMFQYSARIISMQQAGLVPNYEASTAKLFYSELVQRLTQTAVRMFGLYGGLWGDGPDGRNSAYAPQSGAPAYNYLRAVPATIRGGTSEVQRNIIATRGLGLPRG